MSSDGIHTTCQHSSFLSKTIEPKREEKCWHVSSKSASYTKVQSCYTDKQETETNSWLFLRASRKIYDHQCFFLLSDGHKSCIKLWLTARYFDTFSCSHYNCPCPGTKRSLLEKSKCLSIAWWIVSRKRCIACKQSMNAVMYQHTNGERKTNNRVIDFTRHTVKWKCCKNLQKLMIDYCLDWHRVGPGAEKHRGLNSQGLGLFLFCTTPVIVSDLPVGEFNSIAWLHVEQVHGSTRTSNVTTFF